MFQSLQSSFLKYKSWWIHTLNNIKLNCITQTKYDIDIPTMFTFLVKVLKYEDFLRIYFLFCFL